MAAITYMYTMSVALNPYNLWDIKSYFAKIWYNHKDNDTYGITYHSQVAWASYQIHKVAGCACAGNAENVFPTTDFKGNR